MANPPNPGMIHPTARSTPVVLPRSSEFDGSRDQSKPILAGSHRSPVFVQVLRCPSPKQSFSLPFARCLSIRHNGFPYRSAPGGGLLPLRVRTQIRYSPPLPRPDSLQGRSIWLHCRSFGCLDRVCCPVLRGRSAACSPGRVGAGAAVPERLL